MHSYLALGDARALSQLLTFAHIVGPAPPHRRPCRRPTPVDSSLPMPALIWSSPAFAEQEVVGFVAVEGVRERNRRGPRRWRALRCPRRVALLVTMLAVT